jgi:hypothetical protein
MYLNTVDLLPHGLIPCRPYGLWGTPSLPPIKWELRALSLGVKRQGQEADHSPPTSAEVSKMWISTSTPPSVFLAHWTGTTYSIPCYAGRTQHLSNVKFTYRGINSLTPLCMTFLQKLRLTWVITDFAGLTECKVSFLCSLQHIPFVEHKFCYCPPISSNPSLLVFHTEVYIPTFYNLWIYHLHGRLNVMPLSMSLIRSRQWHYGKE